MSPSLVAAGLLAAVVPVSADGGSEPPPAKTCVRAWGEARPRYPGYDHVVHLVNACSVEATCDVATNVNPRIVNATVPAGAHVEVLTFMASPSRTFAINVECEMRRP